MHCRLATSHVFSCKNTNVYFENIYSIEHLRTAASEWFVKCSENSFSVKSFNFNKNIPHRVPLPESCRHFNSQNCVRDIAREKIHRTKAYLGPCQGVLCAFS